jgi:hypothetical protein
MIGEVIENVVRIGVVEEIVAIADVILEIANVIVPSLHLVTAVAALILEIDEIVKPTGPRIASVHGVKILQKEKQLSVNEKSTT